MASSTNYIPQKENYSAGKEAILDARQALQVVLRMLPALQYVPPPPPLSHVRTSVLPLVFTVLHRREIGGHFGHGAGVQDVQRAS